MACSFSGRHPGAARVSAPVDVCDNCGDPTDKACKHCGNLWCDRCVRRAEDGDASSCCYSMCYSNNREWVKELHG